MTGILLIRDLAVVLVAAGGAAWLCHRLGLSSVVGYLLVGALVGPHTPPFALVGDLDRVQTLAQVGLVFLIFSIGLNLSIARLRRLGTSVILATAIAAILMLNVGRLFGWTLGWSATASLFLAGMLMVSSSAIIGKVLEELNLTHERPGQLALGVTVLEDAVSILMLTLLTSLIQLGGTRPPSLVTTMGALGAFVVFLALLSLLVMPKLLARMNRDTLREVRTLIVAGLLLLLAWVAAAAGYSLALGAFVFGAIVGSTRYKSDVERVFEGLDQTFGAVFFVAIGMQVEWGSLLQAWPLLVGVSALALLVRPLACAVGLLAVGNTSRDSIRAGLSLTPMGEFSFIIALLGVESGVLPRSVYSVAVGASVITSLAAPALTRHAEALSLRIERAQPRRMRGWIGFYHGWLAQLRDRQNASVLWRLARKGLLQTAVHILGVSALLLLSHPVYGRVREALADTTGPWRDAVPFLFWSGFGLVLLGPLIAIWRNISALAMILAEAATTGARRQARLRPLLEGALRVVALVVLCVWILGLLPTGWSLLGAAGAVLLLLIVVGAVFWRRFVRLHSRLERDFLEELNRASHATSTSAWFPSPPTQSADWQLDIDEVTLPSDSAHAGRTLGQLAIRNRFGCSVIGIDRQGYGIVNPSANTVVYPLDKILMLGDAEQLATAARALGIPTPADAPPAAGGGFDDLTMETAIVPPGSPLAGRTLLELDLIHRVGVQIGGIRSGTRRLLSPSGGDRLEAGDELLVLGTHAQITEFNALLAAPPRESAVTS